MMLDFVRFFYKLCEKPWEANTWQIKYFYFQLNEKYHVYKITLNYCKIITQLNNLKINLSLSFFK